MVGGAKPPTSWVGQETVMDKKSIVGLKACVGSGFTLDSMQLASIMSLLCFYMQFYIVCSYFTSVSPTLFDNLMF